MKYVVVLSFALACAGCATGPGAQSSADGATAGPLAFQRQALDPRNGGQMVAPASLQPGDILLSSAPGLTSIGVRLLTLSPVSHASLYVGDGEVVEAVGEGVRLRTIGQVLDDESVVVAFRHPELKPENATRIVAYTRQKVGVRYNHLGIVLQAPFSLERRICEVPLVPSAIRDFCIRGIGAIQLGAASNDRFFCSQLVLEAYRNGGLPITDADPRLISPKDIMHMREGDVSSVRIHRPLIYVGHLKFQAPPAETQVEAASGG